MRKRAECLNFAISINGYVISMDGIELKPLNKKPIMAQVYPKVYSYILYSNMLNHLAI